MQTTLTCDYLGELRTEAIHTRSQQHIITDAPPDNNGKGEAFSPTDLVCAALTSCMITIMGMTAEKEKIDLKGLHADVVKIMAANPRRISEIHITFTLPGLNATAEQKEKLKKVAHACPVALSISPEIKQLVIFNF